MPRYCLPVCCVALLVWLNLASTVAVAQEITAENAADAIKRVFEASQRAKGLDDYTGVIETCESIVAAPVDEKQIDYAQRLAAWAYNRRGEMLSDQAIALAEKEESEQAAELDARALADFNRSIELDAEKWKAFHNRGVALATKGQYEEALSDFSRALELDQTYSNTWFNRGEVYFELGKHQQAIDDYSQVLRLKPNDAGALSRRGQAYAAAGQPSQAVAEFTQVLRLAPQDAETYVDRAEALQQLKRWDVAANDLRQAERLGQKSARVYREAAWFLATCPDARFRNDDYAQQAIARAIELEGRSDFRTLEVQAAVLASAGEFEQAATTAEAALEAAPEPQREAAEARWKLYQAGQPYRQAN